MPLPFFRSNVLACGVVLAIAALGATGCTSEAAQRFQHHIDYLASNQLAGRGVGSPGIELAADYIAEQFREIGLQPAGENGTFFQTFDMMLHRRLTNESRLTFEDGSATYVLGKDFIPLSFASTDAFSGDVVFAGYGIQARTRDRDDFAEIDLEGKVVIILRGEPASWSDENGETTPFAMLRSKIYNAKDRGAAAVLIVNQAPTDHEPDRLIEFDEHSADAYGLPAMHITRSVANAQLARGGIESLDDLQERMDAGSHVSAALTDVRADGQASFEQNLTSTRNVIGLLKGQGDLAGEFVVVGAHYDHLGLRKPMARKFKRGRLVTDDRGPQIHNGADDNASGTSGIIEIARSLVDGPPPKRSVLFMAFTAEESGLHGSKHFVDNPTVTLSHIIAMLNLDMIGRMKPGSNTVQIFGVDSSPSFAALVVDAARAQGLQTAPSPDSGGRSDHASFLRREIPSMHFFTGHHGDYHKPSDDSHKINEKDGARVAAFVGSIAASLAAADTRPAFNAVATKGKQPPRSDNTYRVVMGLAPGYGDDGQPGMKVEAVSPDGPADLGGIKSGDRIIRIESKSVANIYDYMAATRNNKPGDVVEVTVLRNGREHTLRVTLAGS